MISTPIGAAARSISISLSSSWPSRSFLRNAASGRRLLMLFRLAPVILGRRDQHVENALFGQLFGTGAVFLDRLHAHHFDGGIGQIADDGIHFFAHIAHFGELGGFNLDERRVGQLRQTTGDFGFTDAGRADHQNVFGVTS